MKIGKRFSRSGIRYEFLGYASKNLMRVRRRDTGEIGRLPVLEREPTEAAPAPRRSRARDIGQTLSLRAKQTRVTDKAGKGEIRKIRQALKEYARSVRPRKSARPSRACKREESGLKRRLREEVNRLIQSVPALSKLAQDPHPFSPQSKLRIGDPLDSVVMGFSGLAFDSREYGDTPRACIIAVAVEGRLCWARVSDSRVVELLGNSPYENVG